MYPFNIYIAFEKYGVKSQQGFPFGTSVVSSPVNIEIDFLCAFFEALWEIVFLWLCCQLLSVSVMIARRGKNT